MTQTFPQVVNKSLNHMMRMINGINFKVMFKESGKDKISHNAMIIINKTDRTIKDFCRWKERKRNLRGTTLIISFQKLLYATH